MKFNKNEFGWKEKVSVNTDELATKNDIPHYNEILITEISGEDYKLFINNSYFNMSALNIDETKTYVGKEMSSNEKYSHKFVYDKEADALICEDTLVNIYNHKSYNGTNFTDDENSAVLTFNITTFDIEEETSGYFKLYEIDKLELDSNCLPDNVSIPNSLTVGTRIGDIGGFSVSEGDGNTASGYYSHAEGGGTEASGEYSHAEGISSTASGNYSHAEGISSTASGILSHTEGLGTKAQGHHQHVQGKYNIEDTERKYAHIVGNGSSETSRSNAHTLDWNGNAWYQGKLSQDGTPTEDKDLATKKYVDDKEAFKAITSESSSPIIINDLSADGLYKLSGDFKIFAEDESTINLSGLFILEEKDVTTKALRLLNNNGAYLSTSYVLDTSAKTYTIKKNEQIPFISAQNNILILKDLAGGVIYETTALGAKINPDDDVILNLGASGRKLVRVTKGRNTQTGITTWLVNVFGSDMLWGQLTVDSNGVITKNECFQYIKNNNVLTLSNTTEYTPTNDYNPATKKYVDDTIASQPQISFDTEGNLVVTIGGVTKKFKEITE